jgi:hypothetical protein
MTLKGVTMVNVVSIILAYLVFATIFYNTEMVGEFTMSVGKSNIALFGYMAYVDIFLLAYLIYAYNKKLVDWDAILGWVLFFLSLTLLQAMIFDIQSVGIVAGIVYGVFVSTLGKFVFGLFIIFSLFVSVSLLTVPENQFIKLYEELLGITNIPNKIKSNQQSQTIPMEQEIKQTHKSRIDDLDLSSYVQPKPKSRLEREREKLKQFTQIFSSSSQIA